MKVKLLFFQLPKRYRSTSPLLCHHESVPDLCAGRCKFYDVWFCGDRLQCTDAPCLDAATGEQRCPPAGAPGREGPFRC